MESREAEWQWASDDVASATLKHRLKSSTGVWPTDPHLSFNRQGTLLAQGGVDESDTVGIRRLTGAIAHRQADCQRLFEQRQSVAVLTQRKVDVRTVVERRRLVHPLADRAEDRQGLRVMIERFLVLAEEAVNTPESAQRGGFAAAVGERAVDGKRLAVQVEGFLIVAQVVVHLTDVEDHRRLKPSCSFSAGKRQGPAVDIDGGGVFVLREARVADALKRGGFARTISERLIDRQRLVQNRACLRVLVQAHARGADSRKRGGFTLPVAESAKQAERLIVKLNRLLVVTQPAIGRRDPAERSCFASCVAAIAIERKGPLVRFQRTPVVALSLIDGGELDQRVRLGIRGAVLLDGGSGNSAEHRGQARCANRYARNEPATHDGHRSAPCRENLAHHVSARRSQRAGA